MGKAEDMRARFGSAVRPPAVTGAVPVSPLLAASVLPAYRTDLEAGVIELRHLHPDPEQPRKEFLPAEIADLAAALKTFGQLTPVLARQSPDHTRWLLVDGERRWRAAPLAGLLTLRALFIRRDLTPAEVLDQQLVSNLLRVDLRPIDQAHAFKRRRELHSWTQQQLADHLHVSQGHVSRVESLLLLPAEVQVQTNNGAIPVDASYEIARVQNPSVQRDLAELAIAGRIDEARAQAMAQRPRRGQRSPAKSMPRSETFVLGNGLRLTITTEAELTDDLILAALSEVTERVRERYHGGRAAA